MEKITKKCSVEDCLGVHYAKSLCRSHYNINREYGSPLFKRRNLERHGMYGTAEYYVWQGMKRRCSDSRHIKYKDYGERGVKVCDRWLHSFSTFYKDMGPRLSPKHSLDRIDVNGNYEPGNCRWATYTEQNLNQRKRVTNTSGYVGVNWSTPRKMWRAEIGYKYSRIFLGHFNTKEEAALAYKSAKEKLFVIETAPSQ